MHNPDDNIQSVMEVQAHFGNNQNLNLDKKFLFFQNESISCIFTVDEKKEHHEQSVLTMTTTRSQKFHRTNKQTKQNSIRENAIAKTFGEKEREWH
jgi:hypothetical protein